MGWATGDGGEPWKDSNLMAGLVTDPGFDLVLFPSSDVCTVTQYSAY